MSDRREKLKAALAEEIAKQGELRAASPTYPLREAMPVEEARKRVASDFDNLIREAEEWWQRHAPSEQPMENEDDPFARFARENVDEDEPPPVHAQRSPTGVGKTRVGAKEIAADRKRRQLIQERSPLAMCPWCYSGPRHRLNEGVAEQFREARLSAQVYYGRGTWDRSIPGNEDLPEDERTLMCLKPDLVALAVAAHQSVADTCCHKQPRRGTGGREETCEHYNPGPNQCGYQRQFNGGAPDVWLAPHEMLFHDQHALSKLAGVIIDESFWSKGVYGIGEGRESLSLDEMLPPGASGFMSMHPRGQESSKEVYAVETYHRLDLVELLREHPLGGLQRERFIGKISQDDCTRAIRAEWDIVDRVKMSPEMSPEQIEQVKQLLPECRRARRMATVYRLLRDDLLAPDSSIEVSGRLILVRRDGKTVLRVRGVRNIVKARNVPTMILDATLPDVSILEKFRPQVRVVSDVEVRMPHVRVRQVLGAPTSETKLWGTRQEQEQKPDTGLGNRKAVRRYILQRWLEIDGHQGWIDSGRERKPLVVICQKKYHEWLAESGLPPGIALEHFGAITGLDDYKHVRSLILIGRTVPPPAEVEAFASALTGVEPLSEAATGHWYGRVPRGIRLADGSGIEVERSDQHCDPVAEAVRWQICEGELIQALGRGRGVNRTAETPLDVDVLADVVLPITVDEVVPWTEPSEAVEMMASEGFELNAPQDMARAFPSIWPSTRAAKWTLKKLAAGGAARAKDIFPIDNRSSIGKMFLALLYVRAANRFRRAAARFDPRRWPNPRAWLEARLGALAALFHFVRKGEIQPMAGNGGLAIDDAKVTVFKAPAKLPWSTPVVEEITDLVLVRQIHAECASAEERTARSPHGVKMVWYEVTGAAVARPGICTRRMIILEHPHDER
jgi:putative DNA primase/helicase